MPTSGRVVAGCGQTTCDRRANIPMWNTAPHTKLSAYI